MNKWLGFAALFGSAYSEEMNILLWDYFKSSALKKKPPKNLVCTHECTITFTTRPYIRPLKKKKKIVTLCLDAGRIHRNLKKSVLHVK